MQVIAMDLIVGWSIGYGYAKTKNKENEVRQGKNYYQASLCQALQVTNLSSVVNQLTNCVPNTNLRVFIKVSSQASSILGFAFLPTCAAVKQGHYENGVELLNNYAKNSIFSILINRLPRQLSTKTDQALSFLAEHSGNLTTAAMLISTAALPIIGNVYLAGAMLAPVAYQTADAKGWVPRKISLAMEKSMRTFTSIGGLIGGGPVFQVFSALHLITFIPGAYSILQRKMTDAVRYFFSSKGQRLAEIDAPVIVNKALSYREMLNIINCSQVDRFTRCTINTAHCSKWTVALDKLPKSYEFDQFLEFFNKIEWERNYVSIRNSFKDDDRFLDTLKKAFPKENDFDVRLFKQAKKIIGDDVVDPERKYLIQLLKFQMLSFVNMLKGENRAQGSQQDTDEAIQNSACILAYLQRLNLEERVEKVELEDILMKLAIEGGEYCARGVKRASREILSGITAKLSGIKLNPQENYELQVSQRLEFERNKILTAEYEKLMKIFAGEQAVTIAQDVHTFDIYRLMMALGFIPITEVERYMMGANELLMWSNPGFVEIRKKMYMIYQLRLCDCIKELGIVHFFGYMRNLIEGHPDLTDKQKDYLMDKMTGVDDNPWEPNEIEERFQCLFLVMHGVLNYNEIYDEWEEIEDTPEPLPIVTGSQTSHVIWDWVDNKQPLVKKDQGVLSSLIIENYTRPLT